MFTSVVKLILSNNQELERKRKIRERAHMLISQTKKSIEKEDFTDNKIESSKLLN